MWLFWHSPSFLFAPRSLRPSLVVLAQRHEVQPDVYARRLGLPVPLSVSAKLGPLPNLWTTVTRIGLDPLSSIPRDPSRPRGGWVSRVVPGTQGLRTVAGWTLGLGVVGAALWAIARFYGVSSSSSVGWWHQQGGGGAAWWTTPWRWLGGGGGQSRIGGAGGARGMTSSTGAAAAAAGAVGLSGSASSASTRPGGGGGGGGSWWARVFGGAGPGAPGADEL